jgi:hypothetical protein
MTRLERLKQLAREFAEEQGHRLGQFNEVAIAAPGRMGNPFHVAYCQVCCKQALIDPWPPNGTPIRGEAVQLDCAQQASA